MPKEDSNIKAELERKLLAVDPKENVQIPSDENLLRSAAEETRKLYLFASKREGTDTALIRCLLARLSALHVFGEVMYPKSSAC